MSKIRTEQIGTPDGLFTTNVNNVVGGWSSDVTWNSGNIVVRDGVLYTCKTDDHVSVTPPEDDTTNWEKAPTRTEFDKLTAVTYTEAQALTGLSDGDQVNILSRDTPLYGLADPFDGGGGTFGYVSGDYSAEVTADTQNGIYLPLDSDPTGSSGALVRKPEDTRKINVRWFGAKADGVTDSHAAYQGAIDYANKRVSSIESEQTGMVIYSPAGHYVTESNLVVGSNSGVSFEGEGKTKSTLEMGDAVTRLLDFSSSNNYRGTVTKMRLTGGIGGSAGTIAYVYDGGNQIDFIDCWIDSAGTFIDTNGFADCRISGNTFEYINVPFKGSGYYDVIISQNMFYGYGPTSTESPPFVFDGCYRTSFIDNKIVYDRISLGAVNSIEVSNSHTFRIAGNIVFDRSSGYPERFLNVTNSQGIDINGNTFGRSSKDTISVVDCQGVSIAGNTLIGVTTGGFYTIKVSGCEDIIVDGNAVSRIPGVDYSNLSNTYDLFVTDTQRINIAGNALIKQGYLTSSVIRFKAADNNTAKSAGLAIRREVQTALPTGKNWELGDSFRNINPTPSGYVGYVITTSGTCGTLNGGTTTGSITSGSTLLTVNDATGIKEGSYLTIAGVADDGKYVVSISGLDIILSSAADATVTDAAVDYRNPVIRGYGLIQ